MHRLCGRNSSPSAAIVQLVLWGIGIHLYTQHWVSHCKSMEGGLWFLGDYDSFLHLYLLRQTAPNWLNVNTCIFVLMHCSNFVWSIRYIIYYYIDTFDTSPNNETCKVLEVWYFVLALWLFTLCLTRLCVITQMMIKISYFICFSMKGNFVFCFRRSNQVSQDGTHR